jgi:hypothetical protein
MLWVQSQHHLPWAFGALLPAACTTLAQAQLCFSGLTAHWFHVLSLPPASAAPEGDKAVLGQAYQPTGPEAYSETPEQRVRGEVGVLCCSTLRCSNNIMLQGCTMQAQVWLPGTTKVALVCCMIFTTALLSDKQPGQHGRLPAH